MERFSTISSEDVEILQEKASALNTKRSSTFAIDGEQQPHSGKQSLNVNAPNFVPNFDWFQMNCSTLNTNNHLLTTSITAP